MHQSVTLAEQQVRALRAQSNDAIAARDVDGVVALMDSSITVAVAGGPVLTGIPANRSAWASQMAEPGFRGYVRTPRQVAVAEDGCTVSERGEWVGRWTTRGGALVQRGSYEAVWVLTAVGGWRIRSEQFVGA